MPDMPESLHDRWANLVEAIRQECGDHGQHADALEVDESALKVRLPLGASSYHSEWFLAEAILSNDPAVMAASFYQRYHEARETRGQAPA
jgi:hypothetical protein